MLTAWDSIAYHFNAALCLPRSEANNWQTTPPTPERQMDLRHYLEFASSWYAFVVLETIGDDLFCWWWICVSTGITVTSSTDCILPYRRFPFCDVAAAFLRCAGTVYALMSWYGCFVSRADASHALRRRFAARFFLTFAFCDAAASLQFFQSLFFLCSSWNAFPQSCVWFSLIQ